MRTPGDRVLTPEGDEHRFVDACFALSTGTRVAILRTLALASAPLHIREIARRVGLDPSPVRGHLEVLVKAGLARELEERSRARRFVAAAADVRLVLSPPERPADVPAATMPTKAVEKATARLQAVQEKIARLERDAAELAAARAEAWREAARRAATRA